MSFNENVTLDTSQVRSAAAAAVALPAAWSSVAASAASSS